MASLIVAITVVPALCFHRPEKAEPKRLVWFERFRISMPTASSGACGTALCRCWPLSSLLAFCGWKVFSMGVVLLPEISSNEATIALSTDDGLTKRNPTVWLDGSSRPSWPWTAWKKVGVTTDTTVAGIDIGQLGLPSAITDLLSAASSYGGYQFNVMLDESLSSTRIAAVEQALNDAVSGVENCTGTVEISGMQDLTSQLSSGLSVQDLRSRRRYHYRTGR